ncbi:T9SS type A sorting domain-containing protein [bacterium]|nr:T9SS type A sorting domain-containing protein [bacterium]
MDKKNSFILLSIMAVSLIMINQLCAQSVTVISPNGGEIWYTGSQHEIKWQYSGIPPMSKDSVRIVISYTGSYPWYWITSPGYTTQSGTGTYLWTVPDHPSTNCYIRILYSRDYEDYSDAAFTIAKPPPIEVLSPNGGESWEAGTPRIIRWNTDGSSGLPVKLEYSTDRGNHFKYIDLLPVRSTHYTWMVPNTPSSGCLVRVSEGTLYEDFSDGFFTITANPTLTVDVPAGGEDWTAGSLHYIVWHCHLFSGPVDIEYSTDGGSHYTAIANQAANSGSCPWTIPNVPSGNCVVRIRGSSSGFPSDYSGTFTISAVATPTITVSSPKSGDEWQAGTQQDILWTCSHFSDPVSISYSTNGGGSYTVIENTTVNDGVHPWQVPDVSSTQCKIRVADASDSDPSGYSDGFFTILATETPAYSLIVTHTGDTGVGSLRHAIDYANTHPGADTILFHIPYTDNGFDEESGVWTISPLSGLPDITGPDLLIDGYSQAEFVGVDTNAVGPEIAIDGTEAGGESSGFTVLSHGVGIRGLIINQFSGMGILYQGVEGGRVSGCYIGTDHTGCIAAPNRAGIVIEQGSYNVMIVQSDTLPNVISGNTESGIVIQDHACNNIIGGTLIGLDRLTGSTLGNGNSGIAITEACDSNVVIDNHIGGNGIGILISGSNYNMIMNNLIGTDTTWTQDLGNQNGGIAILSDATDNKVIENTIGYNGEFGVQVQGSGSIRNRISRNFISKNTNAGILIEDGANEDILSPEIASFFELEIVGMGAPGQILEFFSDEGNQGQRYLGTHTIDNTTGYFKYTLAAPPPFSHITVTAIDGAGNTSQFSNYFVTQVDEKWTDHVPGRIALHQNYPNPFNTVTTISYDLTESCFVTLKIYDMRGRELQTLISAEKREGHYDIQWNTEGLPTGVYLYRLQAGEYVETRKLILQK